MDLYQITKSGLKAVEKSAFDLEKDIQALVEANLGNLFDLQFVSSEFTVGEFRIDTLGFDEEASAFVIIEYKKGSSYSVVDQGYSYLSTMLESKAEFILEFQERTGKALKRDEVDWTQSRVIFVSPAFNTYQKNSVNFRDMPFELWEIRRYSNDMIGLEQHKPTSKESVEKISKSSSVISSVSSEIEVVEESDHLSKSSEPCIELWEQIKEHFLSLGDTGLSTKKHYVSIKRNTKAVCYVHFRKNNLAIDINRGVEYPDGTKSKDFFTLDDPKGVCSDRYFNWASGQKGMNYSFSVKSKDDLEYALWLIKQKYDSMQ
jgi:predicted transport protein